MNTPTEIHYTSGKTISFPVVTIWDDLHNERAGYFRAFWSDSPNPDSGSPVIGYCSPGGSQRTIRACAAEIWRLYPDARIYRNGREIKRGT
jgi:hypothetical protein